MKIRPVRAELFHADGWTDGRTDGRPDRHIWQSWYSLFAVLRRHLRHLYHTTLQLAYTSIFRGSWISRVWYWFCNLL